MVIRADIVLDFVADHRSCPTKLKEIEEKNAKLEENANKMVEKIAKLGDKVEELLAVQKCTMNSYNTRRGL